MTISRLSGVVKCYGFLLTRICKKQGVYINDVRKIIVIMCEIRLGGGGCSEPNEYRYYFIIYIH